MATPNTQKSLSSSQASCANRRRPKCKSKSKNTVTRDQVFGGKLSPPSNPPDVAYQPWFHVTLVDVATTNVTYDVISITSILKHQLDPENRGFNQTTTGDKRFILQMKLDSIRTWNLTGKVIALSVVDFIDTSSAQGGREQLCGYVDTGSTTSTPKVGFKYPLSHRQHVIRSDDKEGDIAICTISASTGDQLITYINLLFKFDGPVKLPTMFSSFQVLSDIRKHTEGTTTVLENQSEVLSHIRTSVRNPIYTLPFPAIDSTASEDASSNCSHEPKGYVDESLSETLLQRLSVMERQLTSLTRSGCLTHEEETPIEKVPYLQPMSPSVGPIETCTLETQSNTSSFCDLSPKT